MVYLNQYQLIPYKRSSEFFEVIYNHKISAGTVVNAVIRISSRLSQVESQIKELLSRKALVHCDETGANVNSERYWVHTVGDKQLTHYGLHKRRGSEASDAIGILPKVKGVMVHDHWKSYFKYKNSRHGLCNAHHLRELRYIYEIQNLRWGKEISDLLIGINGQKATYIQQGGVAFSQYFLNKYSDTYDEILLKAGREQARRGTIDSHNLLKRLKGHKDSVLLFMRDFTVPFTNNLSEQDLRMNKVKQKISGFFKSKEGDDNFCKIRSVLSTGRKNKRNIFQILQEAFQRIISVEDLLAHT
jgi:transposase